MANLSASPADAPAPTGSRGPASRLLSLDALRGFDMFWIVGAEEIVHSLHKVSNAKWAAFLADQLSHKEWQGFAFYDLIFPLFVFIVGVSLVFSLPRMVEQGGKAAAFRRILSRTVILYLLGLLVYGGISGGWERVRLLGVLQRIALCYFFASTLFLWFRPRALVAWCVGLLLLYWALMSFVPVPGIGAGDFGEGRNLANYIDKTWLPLRKWDGDHDPEGLLSTMAAVGTCLLGIFAGLFLKDSSVAPARKPIYLAVAGLAGVAVGFLWGLQFPVIKKIWTSSYVLVAAGYSCLLLAVFYQVIDVWKLQGWAMPFVWIGMNPITIYMAHSLVDFRKIAERFVGGPVKAACGDYGELLVSVAIMALTFLVVRFLYQRKIFIRV